jgi:signal transduction histidine kinase
MFDLFNISKPLNADQDGHSSEPLFLRREGCRFPDLQSSSSAIGYESNQRKLHIELENLNQLLDTGLSAEVFFSSVVNVTAKNTCADHITLAIREGQSNQWCVKVKSGSLNPAIEAVCQRIFITDACVLFEDSKDYLPTIDKLIVNDSHLALLCVPFFVDGQVIGGMTLIRQGLEARFSGPDISLASIMGQWCSLKLANLGLLSELIQSKEHEQKLLDAICRTQEEERSRVSAELHDGVAQWMVGAAYDISICQSLLKNGSTADTSEALQRVKDTLQICLKELRRAIANLRPLPIAELGLIGALNQTATQLTRDGITCTVNLGDKMPVLSIAEESTVFWIIQEALNNIRRHAKANCVTIDLQPQNGQLDIRIVDNGSGFDPEKAQAGSVPLQRFGLTGMKERSEMLGGVLKINSRTGQGTEIVFSFRTLTSPINAIGGKQ